MSEYQYYEFLAIDRPLTADGMAELRALSTRATITPVSFTNEYNWGDFKGDPDKLMERYFDAHVYVANWMTAIFMVRLAQIMKDHEEEFSNEFEFSDLTSDHEYDPDTEVNPFLHVYLHSAVENQLSEREPIEVFQFYNAMRKKKCSHHDSIHLIGVILAPLMFSVIKEQKPFDIETYKHLLKKYKTPNP